MQATQITVPSVGPELSEQRMKLCKNALQFYDSYKQSFVYVMYALEILKNVRVDHVIPAHAYAYARMEHAVPKSSCPGEWNNYVTRHGNDVRYEIAKSCIALIHDLAKTILVFENGSLISAGFPKDIYEQIRKLDKRFVGYQRSPQYEAVELALRHMDITEPDKTRPDVFTLEEVRTEFSEFLNACIRSVKDDADLMERTTPTALAFFSTGLSILYRMFSKNVEPYWYLYDRMESDSLFISAKEWVNTVPVRTFEAALCYSPHQRFVGASIERPVEADGVVDRYLKILHRSCT